MISDVVVQPAGSKGKGGFSLRAFSPGEFLFRRRHGRVVSNRDITQLPVQDRRHLCELDWDTCAVLLSPGCYLNHSCDPNAMRSGVKVFAWKAIQRDEEITIDYRLNAFTGERCECICGATNCRGVFELSYFAMPLDRQRALLPYAPSFIQKEYRSRARGLAP